MANDKMKKGSKTVDPIKSKREIQAVKNYLFGKNLRDYTIFVVCINSALRVSDIVKLKWEDVFNEIGELKKEIRLIETLMKILNHGSQSVTKRYIGITQEEINDVYLNINL